MLSGLSGVALAFLVITVILSVGFHEAMHAFTAKWLGDTTASDLGRISLNPLKHIDIFATVLLPLLLVISGLPPFFAAKPVPFNPARVRWDEYGAALVGIAGPLTNIALAFVGAGLYHLTSGGLVSLFFEIFVEVNVALFIFNMIPFPPLDGSRLLYAFAPEPVQAVMARIESLGLVAILIIMLLFFNVIGPIIINIDSSIINFLLA